MNTLRFGTLEVTFSCPVDMDCEMCFLIEKVAPILISGKKVQIRYTMEEAMPSAVFFTAVYLNAMAVTAALNQP